MLLFVQRPHIPQGQSPPCARRSAHSEVLDISSRCRTGDAQVWEPEPAPTPPKTGAWPFLLLTGNSYLKEGLLLSPWLGLCTKKPDPRTRKTGPCKSRRRPVLRLRRQWPLVPAYTRVLPEARRGSTDERHHSCSKQNPRLVRREGASRRRSPDSHGHETRVLKADANRYIKHLITEFTEYEPFCDEYR